MRNYLFILFLSFFSFSFGQEFSVELFFEDSAGNQDSIILGYDDNATDAIDSSFGETNIITIPYNSGLDVRISDEMISRNTSPDPIPATYHTKTQIFQKNCPISFSIQGIDIVTENWPVTVTWNNLLFDDDCRNGSVLTGIIPGGWWDVSSPTESDCGFFRVQFLNDNQVTFCDNTYYPEYPPSNSAFLTDDNLIVSVFWFSFGNESILLLNNEDYKISNIITYPNPTENDVIIQTNEANIEAANIELFDINGKKSTIKIDSKNSISLESFESGIYFIRLRFKNGKTLMKKIIKK